MENSDSKNWDGFWAKQKSNSKKISWSKKRIINILNPYVEKNKRALDVGCGSGFFSKYFCENGMETIAVDYADNALEITKKLTDGNVKVIKADITSDEFSNAVNGTFDIIFSDGLLEHFSRKGQERIILNLKGLLSDNGVITTFVPNKFSPWQIIRPFYMPNIDETPFVLSTLVSLQKTYNLDIVASGGINTFPFMLSPDVFLGKFFGMILYTIAKK